MITIEEHTKSLTLSECLSIERQLLETDVELRKSTVLKLIWNIKRLHERRDEFEKYLKKMIDDEKKYLSTVDGEFYEKDTIDEILEQFRK